jgi:hypothetical protein
MAGFNDVDVISVDMYSRPKLSKPHSDHPAFDEWFQHLPLSMADLVGIKTYESHLPNNQKPHYLWYGDMSESEILQQLSGGRETEILDQSHLSPHEFEVAQTERQIADLMHRMHVHGPGVIDVKLAYPKYYSKLETAHENLIKEEQFHLDLNPPFL